MDLDSISLLFTGHDANSYSTESENSERSESSESEENGDSSEEDEDEDEDEYEDYKYDGCDEPENSDITPETIQYVLSDNTMYIYDKHFKLFKYDLHGNMDIIRREKHILGKCDCDLESIQFKRFMQNRMRYNNNYESMNHFMKLLNKELHLDRFGLVPAGGVFSSIINNNLTDVDLFMVAQSQEEAESKLRDFVIFLRTKNQTDLDDRNDDTLNRRNFPFADALVEPSVMFDLGERSYKNFKKLKEFLYDASGYEIYITKNCITFYVGCGKRIKCQLILRWYNRPEQIIERFDIATTMIYYYDNNIYMNAEARFAFSHKCIIVNIEKRKLNYAYRIAKYARRGFDLLFYDCILPQRGKFILDNIQFSILNKFGKQKYICTMKKIKNSKMELMRNELYALNIIKPDDLVGLYETNGKYYNICDIIEDNVVASLNGTDNLTGVITLEDDNDIFNFRPMNIGAYFRRYVYTISKPNHFMRLYTRGIIPDVSQFITKGGNEIFDDVESKQSTPRPRPNSNLLEYLMDNTNFTLCKITFEHYSSPAYDCAIKSMSPEEFYMKYYKPNIIAGISFAQ